MNSKLNLPSILPIFPLSNFIFFPNTSIPLNIFEERYLKMVNDCMQKDRIIGMIQPKSKVNKKNIPELYSIGCAGKIISFNETEDNNILLVLNGICRFKILTELQNNKLYRECKISFEEFKNDSVSNKEVFKFSNSNILLNNFKTFFQKKRLSINWKELEKQNICQVINTLSMISPFSLEEKQILLEANNLESRKKILLEILNIYLSSYVENKTIQ